MLATGHRVVKQEPFRAVGLSKLPDFLERPRSIHEFLRARRRALTVATAALPYPLRRLSRMYMALNLAEDML